MTVKKSATGSRPPDPFDSPDFIEKIMSGDDLAFGVLVRGMLPRLTRYVFDTFQRSRYPLSKSDAEDVAQDTMIRISRSVRSGGYTMQANARFTTWIFRISHNLACARYRQLKSRNEVQLSSRGFEAGNRPLDDTEKNKRADSSKAREDITTLWSNPVKKIHIKQVLQSLTKNYRDVLVWAYWDGHTPEEIAQRKGVNVNTVHQWLSRAKKQFRQAYAKL